MPNIPEATLSNLLSLVRSTYPGWETFTDPRFIADEVEYKKAAIQKAQTRLSQSAIEGLIARGESRELIGWLQDLGRDTNLLYLGVPKQGDLAILYRPLDDEAFATAILDLLHGDGPSPDRLERFSRWAGTRNLPNKWTFPTYFLFLVHPETEFFIKPRTTARFISLLGSELRLGSMPSGEAYGRLLAIVGDLKDALAVHEPKDMVDMQSFAWVAARRGLDLGVKGIDADSEAKLLRLLDEFAETYLKSDEGRAHLASYPEFRETASANYEAVITARDAGEDVTDLVLEKLLPHRDTEFNRSRGAWVTVAPAINRDVKTWYENAGWVDTNDWPDIASAILDFVTTVVEEPDELEAACLSFSESGRGKGFQTGMITPILSALVPEQFILMNSKSGAVVKHFLAVDEPLDVRSYPALNTAAHYLINRVRPQLKGLLPEDVPPEEGFDSFCHWLVAIKRYGFGKVQAWKVTVPDEADWTRWTNGEFAGVTEAALADVSQIPRKSWSRTKEATLRQDTRPETDSLDEVWTLATEIQEGDLIVATAGPGRVLGIGVVTGPYEHHADDAPEHRVPVQWDDVEARSISQPSWSKRLLQIKPKEVEAIRDLAPTVAGEGAFAPKAFELLSGLHTTPTREFYSTHQDELRKEVEAPLQKLLKSVGALFPPAMKEVLETERRLFSRIPKNDFGRGGAWDFYWGAFYPRGEKRIASAQLFAVITREQLEFGFALGEYGDEQRERFLNSVRRRRESLVAALSPHIDEEGLVFGANPRGQQSLTSTGEPDTLEFWLSNTDVASLRVQVVLSKEEVLRTPEQELRDRILRVFRQLFPLVLLAVQDDPLAAISDYLELEDDDGAVQPEYPLEDCSVATGFPLETLRQWVSSIHRKGQAVFYGPPGTGKTYMAEQLARHLIGGTDGFSETIQFHPAYAYEDFIQGIRPITRGDGQLEYQMVPGRFVEFCRKAQNRAGTCVLIVDEINRANLSRVFGELMYLLEYRERDMPLAGGGMFRIPANVRILGTMNTADRSIALVDHALRRRFAFLALRPQFDVLRAYHERDGRSVDTLIQKLHEINNAIADPDYHIGITFFLDGDLEKHLEAIWQMEIEPYLEEFFFDDRAAADRFRWEKVKGEVVP